MWLSPVMFCYGLCHMNIQEDPRVLPNSLKGRDVCYHVYMIGAHKRTCVDHQNMSNHTSIYSYHVQVCMWMAALKAIVKRGSALHEACEPVCSLGSWSGRRWLLLILVWHSKCLAWAACNVKHTWKSLDSLVRYINYLSLSLLGTSQLGDPFCVLLG